MQAFSTAGAPKGALRTVVKAAGTVTIWALWGNRQPSAAAPREHACSSETGWRWVWRSNARPKVQSVPPEMGAGGRTLRGTAGPRARRGRGPNSSPTLGV